MKKLLLSVLVAFTMASCADSKTFTDENGNKFIAEPYGWADYQDVKIKNVKYQVSVGNVVLSVLFSETFLVPIWLTGWQIMEPVEYVSQDTVRVNQIPSVKPAK